MTVSARRANAEDGPAIVELFQESGNQHGWNMDKWNHYYRDYPEGEVVSFVAEFKGEVVGHYGLFPVTIGGHQSYLGAHAYVRESMRGLAVVSELMKATDEFCLTNLVPFIVGFANPRFNTVKCALFKWKTLFYARFVSKDRFDITDYSERPFKFTYSASWLGWRFGKVKAPIVSKYQRQGDQDPVFQLLYADAAVPPSESTCSSFECWPPEGYVSKVETEFAQPIAIKVFTKISLEADVFEPENWLIQMGDSDTFVFRD